jgi:hypothetical protein
LSWIDAVPPPTPFSSPCSVHCNFLATLSFLACNAYGLVTVSVATCRADGSVSAAAWFLFLSLIDCNVVVTVTVLHHALWSSRWLVAASRGSCTA